MPPAILLSPLQIRGVVLRNRIVMPAMHLPQPTGRRPNDALTAFYEARARGGAGLIMVGGCGVDMTGSGAFMLGIDSAEFADEYRHLCDTIKKHGAAAGVQLFHAGRYARTIETGEKPVAPSAVRSRLTGETPRELTRGEIEAIIESFASAAGRAVGWGYDVVEVIGSAGYLISQFLSPLTNRRTDEYGGSLAARAKFLVDMTGRIRSAVGPTTAIMLRLSGSDFVEGGNTLEEAAQYARMAVEAGVDVVNVTGGWHETRVPQISGFVPPAGFSYLARRIKESVASGGAYVAASNRINDAQTAERLLENGDADLVSMGRALIADPMMPVKVRHGGTIIPCIACNQSCFDQIFDHKPVSCLVNPASGRELSGNGRPAARAARAKKVVVVGGGPGGCTAAIVAAERGHRVVVFEKEQIGGKAALTARSYGKHEWSRLGTYYLTRLIELGVTLREGSAAAAVDILAESPDCVVLATGAVPATPAVPGVHLPHVLTADAVLRGAHTSRDVVVIGGGAVGCEVALELALEGAASPDLIYFLLVNNAESPETLRSLALQGSKKITIVEMVPKMGEGIGRTTRWTYMEELKRRGVRMMTSSKAVEITGDAVIVECRGERQTLAAGAVVLATGYRPDRALAEVLNGKVAELHVIGDAERVGDAEAAIRQGYEIGGTL